MTHSVQLSPMYQYLDPFSCFKTGSLFMNKRQIICEILPLLDIKSLVQGFRSNMISLGYNQVYFLHSVQVNISAKLFNHFESDDEISKM